MTAPVRIVLIDPSHPGQHRLGRARDEEHGAHRSGAGAAAILSARRRRTRWPPAPTTSWRRARGRRPWPRRSPTAASSPAPPRARARILGIRDAARRRRRASPGWRRRTARRCCSAPSATGSRTEDLQYCNVLVRIPANPGLLFAESRDVGAAARLRDLHGARAAASHMQLELPLAPSGDVEHFYAHLHAGAERDRLRGPHRPLMERLRRLFNRAQLDRNELNILRGILSAVQGRRGQSRAARPPAHERPAGLSGLCGDHAGRSARSRRAWPSA